LFKFLKKIKDKENGKATDDALKLIVKISEGSVRDALSLLDRGLISLDQSKELDLNEAQKIFGYFDKSKLIEIVRLILKGEEKKVIEIYREIYNQGIEPKIFINDFLEIIYYFKNINFLTVESTNFSLNDEDYTKIKEIAKEIDNHVLILFWQFTVRTLQELEIVTNQNLSIEMFLMRLMYLETNKSNDHNLKKKEFPELDKREEKLSSFKPESISQIKNITQEKKIKEESDTKVKSEPVLIDSFKTLLEICNLKKEIKLRYELEKNVNLVNFEKNRIEISFNDDLDKNFVKDLSLKLFEWTNKRWIITLSKTKGELSIREKERIEKLKVIDEFKDSELYNAVLNKFEDANLIDIISKKNK
jgi:DNA polymerase-3 subunit gamma/tau